MADTAHSPKYATVKKYYDAGLWPVNRVYNAVGRCSANSCDESYSLKSPFCPRDLRGGWRFNSSRSGARR